ncbi:uncharacterized protein LOC128993971 [Macrosteles quadrilineatus]|uniref:uncharacterized protein LOC128993971 n=1 Tax=Macrosteles quadrilineatus TaxID=74068 RepID=UPI0023E212CF|nr:uncharacterized protein LOC128993971 [Macrosteles quadrilineatus]
MLLSNGDFIVSSQPANQLIWQHQDGILRQALLTEKDVKSEDSKMELETSSVGANATSVLTLTPVPAAQVIKMNEYKVILSSEHLPMTWQETGKKNATLALTTLPTIKPKVDASPSLMIGKQPVTFTAISNVNLLPQNQYSTIVIKDLKNNVPANILLSNPLLSQSPTGKKPITKPVPRLAKVRKKPITAKKIMLKPPSSLLSQSALERSNEDRIDGSKSEKCSNENSLNSTSNSCVNTIPKDNPTTENTLASASNLEKSSVNNNIPISTPNIIITHNNFSFNSSVVTKSTENNLTLTNLTQTTNFPEILNTVTTSEGHTEFESSDIGVMEHTLEDGGIIITSDGCVESEVENLDSSIINETVLIDSDTQVVCADQEMLLDTGVVVETCNETPENLETVSNEDVHLDHVETILPSDIEHHNEHPSQEYTDKLLSQLQLSDSRTLPNITSSQVSSVLNALAPSDKTDLDELTSLTNAKSDKEPVKCEPTEFVKIESLQMPNLIKMVKPKPPEPKYRVCELNKHTCFRCVSCSFLSLRAESVENHWAKEHCNIRTELLNRQLTRRQIKCLGCPNVVYSKYSLQIHLLCDHNVITTEVNEVIATTLAANKALRDAKRPQHQKSTSAKAKDVVPRLQQSKEGEVQSAVYQSTFPAEPMTVAKETANVSEQKTSEEPQLPSTPSFTLFTDIQLPKDKEVASPSNQNPKTEDSKTVINDKKVARRLRRTARSKLKAEFGYEIKYNFRCMVEKCGVRFTTATNLSYHLRCHLPDSEVFRCPECDLAMGSWSSVTSHLWRQHGVDIDLYCCKLCGYKCNSYSKLINNHIKIHGDERPFLCDICGKGFKTTKQLRNHKAVHRARVRLLGEVNGDSGGCYTCKVCGRSFTDARILRHHTENVHNKLRPYLCTFCAHTASSKSSLRMHIRQHTGEKPFSCNECDYVTADHNSLRRHKMRHSGLRPYQCPYCSYNCIQATTYKVHLKNKHPGLDEGLMFSCQLCPFRTVKKDNYLAHKAEHHLGGNPCNRRKKHLPQEMSQENTSLLGKSTSHSFPEHETVILLEESSDISSVQGVVL